MPEQDLSTVTNTPSTEGGSQQDNSAANDNHVLAKLILEIQQIPEEYLPNLLQIIRLFRQSVILKPTPSDASEQKAIPEALEANRLAQQHKALSDLTRQWIEEGDEQEQTETWEYLRQALDEDRLSNRPLFP
ncbi:hypothetical protein [Allocoleopsis sp.]|uniref:hypothetical protein n=1 Tax=Allocoleopsis sp. TaxID=3088169 RepID=UPI002FCF3857